LGETILARLAGTMTEPRMLLAREIQKPSEAYPLQSVLPRAAKAEFACCLFSPQGSPTTAGFLIACLALVLAFEFSNGFHDTANAVATVIYTNSLKPLYAVVWSGLMNFLGVLLGGIAVAAGAGWVG
jgi:Phosphate transporter family